MNQVLQTALKYLAAGYSVIPIKLDGTKAPHGVWQQYQGKRASQAELEKWFPNDATHGIGLVQGAVSGNSEVLDFDLPDAYAEFESVCRTYGAGDVFDKLTLRVDTPSGGVHLYYRCDVIGGNEKLAMATLEVLPDYEEGISPADRIARDERHKKDGHRRNHLGQWCSIKTKIETRGEGGQVVAPGSPDKVHNSGKSYKEATGSFDAVPLLTSEERELLHALARACNSFEEMERQFQPREHKGLTTAISVAGNRPGDDYSRQATNESVRVLFEQIGCQVAGYRGDAIDMTRPGKSTSEGISLTIGFNVQGLTRVFTSGMADFLPSTSYTAFQVLAFVRHGGDFSAAAKELGTAGYGEQLGERTAKAAKERYAPQAEEEEDDFLDAPEIIGATGDKPVTDEKPEERIYLTDLGNARRLVDRHGKNLRYSPALGWLAWDGKRWERDESGQVERWAKETVMAMYGEAAALLRAIVKETNEEKQDKLRKRAEALQAWAKKSQGAKELAAMQKLAKTEPGMYVSIPDLDRSPWLLNCQNGTLDLRTGTLQKHRREDLLTKVLPVAYEPEATCPAWEKFLLRVLPDLEVRAYVQRASGYSLTGDVGEQCLFFLFGDGSNGKSTFLKTMLSLMTGYGQQAPADLLIVKQGNSIPNDVAGLRGARLVATIEVEDGKRMAEGLMKQLTGGDAISARFMRGEWFQFEPTFKIFLAANHRPQIATGDDFAVWRRIKVIPFTERIEEHEKDARLGEKLRGELAGILAWAVRGCLEWQAKGMQEPKAVSASIEAYRSVSDVIGRFIEEACVLKPTAQVKGSQLYAAYAKWCEENGHRPMSSTKFGELMGKREGIEKAKSSGNIYWGIGICHPRKDDLGYLGGLGGNSDMTENITSSQEPHIRIASQLSQPTQKNDSATEIEVTL